VRKSCVGTFEAGDEVMKGHSLTLLTSRCQGTAHLPEWARTMNLNDDIDIEF